MMAIGRRAECWFASSLIYIDRHNLQARLKRSNATRLIAQGSTELGPLSSRSLSGEAIGASREVALAARWPLDSVNG